MIQKMRKLRMVWVCVTAMMITAACSNKEIENDTLIDLSEIQFTMQEEKFEPEENLTRAISAEPQSVDLGDGLTAEVSLTEDVQEEAPQTRATISDGKYFIYAINEADNTESVHMTGTFKDGKFTRDAASPRLMLNPGTYTFVCGTVDGVQNDSPTSMFTYGEKNTMIGVTKHKLVGSGTTNVAFVLKHQTARLRFKVLAYTPEIQNATIKLTSDAAQPFVNYYSVNTEIGTWNAANQIDTQPKKVAKTPLGKDAKFVQANVFMTEYEYLVSEVQGNDLKLNFVSGTAYGNVNLAGKTLDLNVLVQTVRNKSYTIQVKLKPTIYLFNDGTCGVLAEKGTRTPIGIVYSEKTNMQQGVAMGLHGTVQEWEATTSPTYSGNNYTTAFANSDDALQDENGYNWTWTSSTDVDGLVKANQQTRYPAFYWASHDPYGVGFGEWYFPAIGEIINVFDKLAKKTNVSGNNVTFEKKLKVIKDAFENAGGTSPLEYRSWSSTIYAYPGFSSPIVLYKNGGYDSYEIVVRPQGAQKSHLTRIKTYPFVRF